MGRSEKVTRTRFIGVVSLFWLCGAAIAVAQDAAPLDPDAAMADAESVEVDEALVRQEFKSLDEDVQSFVRRQTNGPDVGFI